MSTKVATQTQKKQTPRERLGSRLGFILLSAGCAIGLGNIWRFPFITGQYGGAIFLIAYFFFLLAVGLPIIIMEFSVGRAARKNMGLAFHELTPQKPFWQKFGCFGYFGSLCILMFYIPVSSWLVSYCFHSATGELINKTPAQVGDFFGSLLQNPTEMFLWSSFIITIASIICACGVRGGVERVVKFLMLALLVLLFLLAGSSLSLPGAAQGLAFYLLPDFARAQEAGILNLLTEAMNQAFFTLSIGIGAMLIFGSYLDKNRTLTGEAIFILGLDTFVALVAGLIIFPACFTYGVAPNAGPSLIFITLPNVFNEMSYSIIWATLFFTFMSFAALTTIIALFENIISYCCDVWGWTRKHATFMNFIFMNVLILPCILGFNVWSFIQPFGAGSTILDFEDFIVSNNMLPIGSFIFLLYCTSRYGWGFDKFKREADIGKGIKFPRITQKYLTYVLPIIIVFLFIQGYARFF